MAALREARRSKVIVFLDDLQVIGRPLASIPGDVAAPGGRTGTASPGVPLAEDCHRPGTLRQCFEGSVG